MSKPLTLALAVALTMAMASCVSRTDGPSVPIPPLMLIGLDGLEWDLVTEMVADNRLPHLARLMRDGVYGKLEVTRPTLSPIIWTSIATGVSAERHGITGFVHPLSGLDGGSQTRRLYTSRDRRVKAFWNILSDAGRRVCTIGWWMTFPAEAVNGVMVAQVNSITPAIRRAGKGIWKGRLVAGLEGQVYPSSRQAGILAMLPEVQAMLPDLQRRVFALEPNQLGKVAGKLLEQSAWAFRADALYHKIALELLATDDPFDVFAVYFGGADVVGHRFWRYTFPHLYRHPPSQQELAVLGDVVRAYYAYLDGLVGELIAAAPAEVSVVIVSDHGMKAIRRNSNFASEALSGGHLAAPPALMIASGPLIEPAPPVLPLRSLSRLGSVLDLTPTVLAMQGVAIGRDMEGVAMEKIIKRSHLDSHPIRYLPTHTTRRWLAQHNQTHAALGDIDERLEQLRTLGYLD